MTITPDRIICMGEAEDAELLHERLTEYLVGDENSMAHEMPGSPVVLLFMKDPEDLTGFTFGPEGVSI